MTVLSKTERNMLEHGVGWFKFDEASGNVTDSKGTAMGTINGGVTRVAGYNNQGKALNFNGTNGYVQFNQAVIPTSSKFSFRFKVYLPASSTSLGKYIFATYGNTNAKGILIAKLVDNVIRVSFRNLTTTVNVLTSPLQADRWHEIMVSWDGTVNSNGIKLYANDMKKPISTGTWVSTTFEHSYSLAIGNSWADGVIGSGLTEFFFNGLVDSVEVYNSDTIHPYDNQIFLSKKPNEIFSLKGNKIIEPDNQDEQTIIDHGIDANMTNSISTSTIYNGVTSLTTQNQVLGEGKTFTHTIDLDKWRGKKIIL